jgi:hypothetical protein
MQGKQTDYGILRMAFLFSTACQFTVTNALADFNHFANVIPGGRATGMGGAYTAIADDSSAVLFNPGGLGFVKNKEISLTTNAYLDFKETNIVKTEGNLKRTGESGSMITPHFGVVKPLDFLSGLSVVAGFSVTTPDAKNAEQTRKLGSYPSLRVREIEGIDQLNTTTTDFLGAMGLKVTEKLGLGFSVGYRRTHDVAVVARAGQLASCPDPAQVGTFMDKIYHFSAMNQIDVDSFLFGTGFRYVASPRISLGASARFQRIARQEVKINQMVNISEGQRSTSEDPDYAQGLTFLCNGITSGTKEITSKNEFIKLPWESRIGLGISLGDFIQWTIDVIYNSSLETKSSKNHPVWNYATGLESKFFSLFLVRTGIFSNLDATKKNYDGTAGSYANFYGGSFQIALNMPDIQYSVGAVYQKGSGEGSELNGVSLYDIQAQSVLGTFSITHQL